MNTSNAKVLKIFVIHFMALSVLLIVFVLNKNYYFGFNGHIPVPQYAGDTDRECDRTLVKQTPCRYKFEAGPAQGEVALIGDSHAAGLSDLVLALAQRREANLDIWTRTGCKFVPREILTKDQLAYFSQNSSDCAERNLNFSRSLTTGDYSTVIISWRSTNCIDNKFIGTCSSEFVTLMKDTLVYLAQFSRVIVIGPTFEYSDEKFLKPTVLFAKSREEPTFAKWSELIQETETEAQLTGELRIGNVVNVNPRDTLCNHSGCFLSILGNWTMRDNNHLSRYGSMLLLKPLLSAIPVI
jgi:hypothetical protein